MQQEGEGETAAGLRQEGETIAGCGRAATGMQQEGETATGMRQAEDRKRALSYSPLGSIVVM